METTLNETLRLKILATSAECRALQAEFTIARAKLAALYEQAKKEIGVDDLSKYELNMETGLVRLKGE